MPTVTELADQVEKSNNRLTASIDRLSNEFSEFRLQVTTRLEAIDAHLKWAKWIGVTLAGIAVASIGYTHQAVRYVTHLEDTVNTMQQSAKERDSQFVKAMEALERIEKSHLNQPSPKLNP